MQDFNFLNIDSVLEEKPIVDLVELRELNAYRHDGFWQPMDTYREMELLNYLWGTNKAEWKNWWN